MEKECEPGRLDESQDHGHVPCPLGDHLATRLPFLLQRLQFWDHNGEQLHDDRRRDVGNDPQGEHRELFEGATREQVEQTVDSTRLLLGLEQSNSVQVDAWHRNGGAKAVDTEHGEREEDLRP